MPTTWFTTDTFPTPKAMMSRTARSSSMTMTRTGASSGKAELDHQISSEQAGRHPHQGHHDVEPPLTPLIYAVLDGLLQGGEFSLCVFLRILCEFFRGLDPLLELLLELLDLVRQGVQEVV